MKRCIPLRLCAAGTDAELIAILSHGTTPAAWRVIRLENGHIEAAIPERIGCGQTSASGSYDNHLSIEHFTL
jgi:hypothetical protein